MTRVLVTRPEPDATAFAEKCRHAGLTPIVAPLMRIVIERKPVNLQGIGALAFTSANGVRAFSSVQKSRDIPVFAIGGVTGEAARAAGFENILIAEGDVDSLALLVDRQREMIDGALIHIAGAHRAGDLVSGLKQRGLEARREVLYEATAVDSLPEPARAALLPNTSVEWVSFFSPRTAALFMALVKDSHLEEGLRSVRAACLSQTVADALAGASWKSIEIAPRRDADSVIALITGNSSQDRA